MAIFDVDPDFPASRFERHKERMRKEGVMRFESRHRAKDGRIFTVEVTTNYYDYKGNFLGIAFGRDISERKQAEEALRASEEKFSTLFRLMPDKVLLMDLETMTIADVNEAFVRFSGYSRAEALGRTISELGITEDGSRWREIVDLVKAKGRVDNLEIGHPNREGELCTFSLSGRVVSFGGKAYLLLISRDITESKEMQAMMVQTEKMLSIGGIAAGVAHEINNPLGIVLQAAQNLRQRCRPDFRKNRDAAEAIGLDLELMAQYMADRKLDVFLDDIQSGIERAAHIVQRMLNFSRRSESQRAVCDIREIVENAIAFANNDFDLKRCYDFKQIRLSVDIAEDLPVFYCTATEIEQVLLNLLRNSAQAIAEVAPPLAEPQIAVRVYDLNGWVRIEVQDNGPGMPTELKERVMEPFFTTKKPGVGTGLGLSVSHFIVTRGHGGRFSVDSKPGQGTLFVVELPSEAVREQQGLV